MNMKLQKAADIVRKAVSELLNGPLPEAMEEDRFELYIPNFCLEGGQTVAVRVFAEETKMSMFADMGVMKSECRKAVLNAMNELNNKVTHTRAVLHKDSIFLEAGCFLYVDEENEAQRIENIVLHYLRHLRYEGKALLDANVPAVDEGVKKPSASGGINFNLFDS